MRTLLQNIDRLDKVGGNETDEEKSYGTEAKGESTIKLRSVVMKLTRRRAMEPLAATARTANVERLAREQFDVLVIGGGITGAGGAPGAAARGERCALAVK